ncbi:MAG TPA: DUF2231 domain-containing protein [Tepidisphaeraceae bacterium]|jgi:uncharacterized membrane protein
MRELIEPNWHIAVVHFPIGLIVIGTLVELFSFLGWRGSGFRRAGRWMLLLGAVLAVPTAFSGMYALASETHGGIDELRKTNPRLADEMTWHVWSQAGATALAMFVVVLWISLSDFWRDRLNLLFKLLLIGVSGLILVGAHLGGEVVYGHGYGVDPQRPPTSLPTSTTQLASIKTYEELAPVDQTHVTFAGLAMAVACITLGLAIRTASAPADGSLPTDHAERIAAAFTPADINDPTYPPEPVVVSRNTTPPVPVARFWLLSALLLTVTALLGDWIIALEVGWDINAMWEKISKPIDDGPALSRLLAHFVVGGTLIVDTLILALLARFAPRRSVLLLVFALPLVIALVTQIWLGILLLFDGPAGAVTGFRAG